MQKILLPISLIAGLLWTGACTKDLDVPAQDIPAYAYASLDANGGSWKPILLNGPDEIALDAPEPVNSVQYRDELSALSAASANLSSSQREAVEYWGANALVRWNEIARDLVAKYNIPPAANPDGTYPGPNPQNPGVYPFFPFSAPPYSCRAYAYWSAAQFDALITAWHYKNLYQRPAPYTTDASITTHLPKNELPSFPSEDAVIAAVSVKILTAMFPLEADFLLAKAEEHRNSRKWAGMNTDSDLAAGALIGEAVAAKFLVRAQNDGMKNAGGNAMIQDSLRNAAQNQFGWSWISLEVPKRPGMLPLYGRVQPWCIPNVESVRPGPPPAIGSPAFNTAVEELQAIADNLTAEQRRIANDWGDGVSTHTPPGHWNQHASELIIEARMNPLRTARVFAYLNMAIMDAGISCWDTKYYYHYPRPSQAVPGFRSLLGLPNFPSYTSGHSTFSSAAATVLAHFFPAHASDMHAQALEASLSRIYGGIHYRFDCEVGQAAGNAIGAYSVGLAQQDGAE